MIDLHLVTGFQNREHITAVDVASFNAAIFGKENRVLESGSQFEISENVSERANELRIRDGEALMQGRHIRMNIDDYGDLVLEPCKASSNRKDLIVIRYIKNIDTGVETAKIIAITGAEVASTEEAILPPCENDFTETNNTLTGKAILADMPLYEIVFENGNIVEKNKLFTVLPRLDNLVSKIVADMTYPVGIIVQFAMELDPNEIWKGTKWKRLTDIFFKATAENEKAGGTGGKSKLILTVDNMPSHTHGMDNVYIGGGVDHFYAEHALNGWGSFRTEQYGGNFGRPVGGTSRVSKLFMDSNHVHRIHNTGGNQPIDITPKHMTVAAWVRTE